MRKVNAFSLKERINVVQLFERQSGLTLEKTASRFS